MQVVIYGKTAKDRDLPYIQEIFDLLHDRNINVFVYEPFFHLIESGITLKKDVGMIEGHVDFNIRKFDFIITLGGDGTILSATTLVRDKGVPIMGINLGRLGFLASIEKQFIERAIDALISGQYTLESRTLLQLESNSPLFGDLSFAMNDFTIHKRDNSSMITIRTFINGNLLNNYWADGLIVSTPTGSTGYSLSCGGPIVFPNSGNFIITPVAPHNLNVRPIVISDDSVISFEVEGRAENFLCTLDSRFETITSAHQIAIRKCNFQISVVQLNDRGFLETLREKISWGSDYRN